MTEPETKAEALAKRERYELNRRTKAALSAKGGSKQGGGASKEERKAAKDKAKRH